MKLNEKKFVSFLIVLMPLTLVLIASFFISTFYLEKVTNYFNSAKERSIKEHIDSKKAKSEVWIKQLNLLFDYKYNRIEENIVSELNSSVEAAYKSAHFIYNKYKNKKSSKEIKERIVDALSQLQVNGYSTNFFISDFNGNAIVSSKSREEQKNLAAYVDADGRSIVLEEIQLVRKKGEGFLSSRYVNQDETQRIKVKNLHLFDWYIGSSLNVNAEYKKLKLTLLDMTKSIPLERTDFIALYSAQSELYLSPKMADISANKKPIITPENLLKESMWYTDNNYGYYYYAQYNEALSWYLIYGFEISSMSTQEIQKQQDLEEMLDNELNVIMKASIVIVLLVVILSLLLSRRVNSIFREYQEEVENRTAELENLNASLEYMVNDAVKAHRQKDKILIQQSKMAEMGDMLSMIAHQWRQPLNQMSYVLMNIDSAFEFKELDKKYLDAKIKEGNGVLEFMSETIDNFRNYFRPNKEKEFVLVSDVIQTTLGLMKSSLDVDGIEVEMQLTGSDLTHIYRNEFMQVILNLVKNAKDILKSKNIKNPKIVISAICRSDSLVVSVCDNAGGVDEKIIDKIFEPYFSTKDVKSGTGLGLYMSKMIIEEYMDGKLSVVNTKDSQGVNVGACFKIEI